MKKKSVNLVASLKYLLLCHAFIMSCTNANSSHTVDRIKSISISTNGGQLGYYRRLLIMPDTLYFEQGLRVDTSHRKSIKKINTQYQLEELISTNQLTGFSKIISGKSRQPFDGIDTEVVIRTYNTEIKVRNGGSDKLWLNVVSSINKIIEKEFKE
ncbi:hypothetical protein [Pedobacter jeongneungensis]|uniref:hypothetical protein n=1 Tax=Pedobacter jeongneungensis TaxID=947309 RepID=UPI000469D613|nr:hypothetical protein [Pedobacter jeongneungensis]